MTQLPVSARWVSLVLALAIVGCGSTPAVGTLSGSDRDGPLFEGRAVLQNLNYVWGVTVADVDADGKDDITFGHVIRRDGALDPGDATLGGYLLRRNITTHADWRSILSSWPTRVREDWQARVKRAPATKGNSAARLNNASAEQYQFSRLPVSSFYWARNMGGGVFNVRSMLEHEPGYLERHWTGDLDRNGRTDVIVAENYYGRILRLEQDEHGAWKKTTLTEDLPRAYDVAVHDLNADGHLDVVASGYAWGAADSPKDGGTNNAGAQVAWFENPGSADAPWRKHLIDGGFEVVWNVDAADLDGDGTPEIVATSWPDDKVYMYRRSDSAASGWQRSEIGGAVRPAHGAIVDIDADGQLDVVVAAGLGVGTKGTIEPAIAPNSGQGIFWFRNPGRAALGSPWTRSTIVETPLDWIDLVAGDLDGQDGVDIVATAWREPGLVAIFRGFDKGQTWRQEILRKPWPLANQPALIDVNGDRRQDVLVANDSDGLFAWLQRADDGSVTGTVPRFPTEINLQDVSFEPGDFEITKGLQTYLFNAAKVAVNEEAHFDVLAQNPKRLHVTGVRLSPHPQEDYWSYFPARVEVYEVSDGSSRLLVAADTPMLLAPTEPLVLPLDTAATTLRIRVIPAPSDTTLKRVMFAGLTLLGD